MNKNLLINLSRLLTYFRRYIDTPDIPAINDIIIDCISGKKSNSELVHLIKNQYELYLDYQLLDGDSKQSIDLQNFCGIFLYAFERIRDLLKLNQYDEAYDVVDAVHALPEIFAEGRTRWLRDYWKTYIVPLNKKWKKKYFIQWKSFFK